MLCTSCGSKKAHWVRVNFSDSGEKTEYCSECSPSSPTPTVYGTTYKSHYNYGLGEYISSHTREKEICRERGCTPIEDNDTRV